MTRWIRGRLGRPIASILFGLMLVSFILPLAPPRAQAQIANIAKLFGEVKQTTPIAVVDFDNRSAYPTGMLGRAFADAISMELVRTGTFEVIKRQQVEQVMTDNHLTIPLNWAQQAIVAERLCTPTAPVNFTVSGDIDAVHIRKTEEGTKAEVSVRVLIISRITGMPINGAFVMQSSSPKIGYTGNTDSLIHEALSTAAFQAVMKIMDSRVPIGTMLTSPRNGEIVIKGGATLGFRVGMECTTMRRDSVTGRIRLTEVTPNESSGSVLEESKGIAPGDKVLPIFEFSSTARRSIKGAVGQAGLYVAAIAAGALLFSLIATNNNDNALDTFAAPLASTLADAESLNYPTGANIVRWKQPSQRVVAYIIYRDIAPNVSPIAVVDGNQNYYIDSTSPLNQAAAAAAGANAGEMEESITYTIAFIDQTIGNVQWTETTVYDSTVNQGNPAEQFSETEYNITTHRVPLAPGQKVGYQIKVLYMDYLQNGLAGENNGGAAGAPMDYSFYLGNKGADSNRATVVQPPPLLSPADDQLPPSGVFSCTRVPTALDYVLEYSTDNINFYLDNGSGVQKTISPNTITITDTNYAANMGINKPNVATNVYWRIGAKVDGEADPYILSETQLKYNYVFSPLEVFTYQPPPNPSLSRRYSPGSPGGKLPLGSGRNGSSSRL